ncbi:hypothetical protein [Lentzea kentuckyensis]|uniref:hypothetical protein n=1 Tax=Lentzea kentuckyensis TaxID=360086 RepID=UPI000A38076E|nr:hypothetical protein [Lentzea kentuckyensis]
MTMADADVVLVPQPCPVPFRDCSQRTGDIGWAQQVRWKDHRLAGIRGLSDDLCFSTTVPAGTKIDDFLTAIVRMVSRHESLRTRFHVVGNRVVSQESVGGGEVDVVRYQVPPGQALTDELLRGRTAEEPLDIQNGLPFRAGFAAADGEVTHVAFCVARMIADAAGCENVVTSFRSELAAITRDTSAEPGRPFQQLDQVGWETSAAGLRAERQALDYWQEQMAVINALPRPSFAVSGPVRTITAPVGSLLDSADDVARTSGTSSSGVLLTAFLLATAQHFDVDAFGCYLHCSNRSDLARQESITRLKNMTMYTYSRGPSDFRSAVREVFRGSLSAYRHAQSPGELFLPRLGVDPEHAPFVHFNDVRSVVARDGWTGPAQRTEPGAAADPDEPAITETPAERTNVPATLNLGVGPIMGASAKPVLTFETNLLRADGIARLVERMHHILAAARHQR